MEPTPTKETCQTAFGLKKEVNIEDCGESLLETWLVSGARF